MANSWMVGLPEVVLLIVGRPVLRKLLHAINTGMCHKRDRLHLAEVFMRWLVGLLGRSA
jgi:hypothetical protein